MQECGAAILIFSADERYRDEDGNEFWKPAENVVHELGAASMLYDDRIILFKEESVKLATNYASIGFIEYAEDQLNAKVNELLRELISFNIPHPVRQRLAATELQRCSSPAGAPTSGQCAYRTSPVGRSAGSRSARKGELSGPSRVGAAFAFHAKEHCRERRRTSGVRCRRHRP